MRSSIPDRTTVDRLLDEPALLELLVLVLLALLGIAWWRRLHGLAAPFEDAAGGRLRDFAIGVEQVLGGDVTRGGERLERVVEADPRNVTARLLLARARLATGDAVRADEELLHLERAFGYRSSESCRWRTEALMDLDRVDDAIVAARSWVTAAPHAIDAWRALVRAESAQGEHVAAAASARRLAGLASAAGTSVVGAVLDDLDAAARRALADESTEAARELANTIVATSTAAEGEPRRAAWLAVAMAEFVGAAGSTAAAADAALVAGLERLDSDATLDDWLVRLAVPEADPHGELDAPLFVPVTSVGEILDAIEENPQHVRRLVERAADGDARAADELVVIGGTAAPFVGEELLCGSATGRSRLIDITLRLGECGIEALVDALVERVEAPRARPALLDLAAAASSHADRTVVRVIERRLVDVAPGVRGLLVDVLVAAVAPGQEFESLAGGLPLVEIVAGLGRASGPVLRAIVDAYRQEHGATRAALRHPTFDRAGALIDALPTAAAAADVEAVIVARGPESAAIRRLVELLASDDTGPALSRADRILDAFGDSATPFEVAAAFGEPAATGHGRLVARLLARRGGAVPALCDAFGPAPAPTDAAIVALLARIGDAGVADLVQVFERDAAVPGAAVHRRAAVLDALARIDSKASRSAVEELGRRHERTLPVELGAAFAAAKARRGHGERA